MPSKEDYAYAAGLIDGEGCFQIANSPYAGRIYYRPTLQIGMCDPYALSWLAETFGGKVYTNGRAKERTEASYQWALNKRETLKTFIEAILPYLKTKKVCGLIILEFYSKFPKYTTYIEKTEKEAFEYKKYLQEANSTGPGSTAKKLKLLYAITGVKLELPKASIKAPQASAMLEELQEF